MAHRSWLAPVLVAAMVLSACSLPPPQSDSPPMADPTEGAIRMAAVGDSITAGDSMDFAGGQPGGQSWVSYAVGPGIEFVGGWAEWGAPVARMAESVGPLDADVLVIVAGTNDAGWTPHSEITGHLTRIVDNAGVAEVVLSAVPPNDFGSDNTSELNAVLEAFADERDWTWVDGAADLRENGTFAEGMSYDGVHLTEAGARVLGETIGAAVAKAASE